MRSNRYGVPVSCGYSVEPRQDIESQDDNSIIYWPLHVSVKLAKTMVKQQKLHSVRPHGLTAYRHSD